MGFSLVDEHICPNAACPDESMPPSAGFDGPSPIGESAAREAGLSQNPDLLRHGGSPLLTS